MPSGGVEGADLPGRSAAPRFVSAISCLIGWAPCRELFGTLRAALADALSKGSRRLLATYLQTLLAYPDGCTRGETVFDPESGDVLAQAPPLNEERLYPKERALLDLVAAERLAGRRVLVYVTPVSYTHLTLPTKRIV